MGLINNMISYSHRERKPLDKKKERSKMVIAALLVVLFFRPILRAVGLINEALNAGLDRAEKKSRTKRGDAR